MDELIKKNDAIKSVERIIKDNRSISITNAIRKLPTIDAIERKRGEWYFTDDGYFYCSVCGIKPKDQTAFTDFCASCGADMREREDE